MAIHNDIRAFLGRVQTNTTLHPHNQFAGLQSHYRAAGVGGGARSIGSSGDGLGDDDEGKQ
jgi:hypothetical protein